MSTKIVSVALVADSITLTGGAPSGQVLTGNGADFVPVAPVAPTVGGGAGYVTLPGGLILQWGNHVSVTENDAVAFPIEFTNGASVNVQLTSEWPSGDVGYCTLIEGSVSAAGFTVHISNQTSILLNWFAVGV